MRRRARFLILTAADGKPYWTLIAANGEVLCTSETFESRQACEKGIRATRWAAWSGLVDRGRARP